MTRSIDELQGRVLDVLMYHSSGTDDAIVMSKVKELFEDYRNSHVEAGAFVEIRETPMGKALLRFVHIPSTTINSVGKMKALLVDFARIISNNGKEIDDSSIQFDIDCGKETYFVVATSCLVNSNRISQVEDKHKTVGECAYDFEWEIRGEISLLLSEKQKGDGVE